MAKKRARKGDEAAEKLANKVAQDEMPAAAGIIPGQITLELETPDGEEMTKVFRIRPGHPQFRLPGAKIVSSAALLKLASGLPLTAEETAKSPALAGMDRETAREFITRLVAIGSHMIEEII